MIIDCAPRSKFRCEPLGGFPGGGGGGGYAFPQEIFKVSRLGNGICHVFQDQIVTVGAYLVGVKFSYISHETSQNH